MISYRVIRSRRRTMSMEIQEGALLIRAPQWAGEAEIRTFVEKHRSWAEKHLKKAEAIREAGKEIRPLTEEELRALAAEALRVIPGRVRTWAEKIGVTYGRITVRNQRTKWGSCTSRGNLNFNCLLMLAPPQVLDSIIVHELCHRKVMNHSPAFYAEVLKAFPEYRTWEKWLKENGPLLMKRNP